MPVQPGAGSADSQRLLSAGTERKSVTLGWRKASPYAKHLVGSNGMLKAFFADITLLANRDSKNALNSSGVGKPVGAGFYFLSGAAFADGHPRNIRYGHA